MEKMLSFEERSVDFGVKNQIVCVLFFIIRELKGRNHGGYCFLKYSGKKGNSILKYKNWPLLTCNNMVSSKLLMVYKAIIKQQDA
jgi:hypothetical protein